MEKGPWALMPQGTSPYPWRTANDADFDITGRMRPQGAYRSIVWGSGKTYLFSRHPETYGKTEITSMWGFPAVTRNWNYGGYENKPVEVLVFSGADEVELLKDGKPVAKDGELPGSVCFDLIYTSGKLEAVSYSKGQEISRDQLETSGKPAKLSVIPEKTVMRADGHDLVYVNVEVLDEKDRLVTDAAVKLTAAAEGSGYLAGFGTGNPVTEENYTDNETTSFCGQATAVIRSGYETGETVLIVSAEGMEPVQIVIR